MTCSPTFFHDDLPGLRRKNPEMFAANSLPRDSDRRSRGTSHSRSRNKTAQLKDKQQNDDRSGYQREAFEGIGPPLLKMTQSVYGEILDDLIEEPFSKERAGILLGPTAEDDLVTHYFPDTNGHATHSSFTLDAEGLNEILQEMKLAGLTCKGVAHAHPSGVLQPSWGDLIYVAKLFANPKNEDATQVLLPIICNGRLYPYVIDAERPQEILVAQLILI